MKEILKDLEQLTVRYDNMILYLTDKLKKSKDNVIDEIYIRGAIVVYTTASKELKKILIKQYGTTKTKHIRKTSKDTGGVKCKKTAKK